MHIDLEVYFILLSLIKSFDISLLYLYQISRQFTNWLSGVTSFSVTSSLL